MRDPHRSPYLFAADDVALASVAHVPTSHGLSLTNERRPYTPRPNVLMIGPVPLVEAMLTTIAATLFAPVRSWTPEVELAALGTESTVVIRDVATVCLDRQKALLTWLSESPYRPQIVATSSVDVFTLVTEGLFLEDLYYRLNTVVLNVR